MGTRYPDLTSNTATQDAPDTLNATRYVADCESALLRCFDHAFQIRGKVQGSMPQPGTDKTDVPVSGLNSRLNELHERLVMLGDVLNNVNTDL